MTENKSRGKRELEYHIISYDNKQVDEEGKLDSSHSELTDTFKKVVADFQDKYKGRLEIKAIIR